ncbi:hypothetical protein B9J83_09960 [Vibrio sp. V07_P2A8T137]|nr:hypothetical protein B9J83_09960 [Vibrio sp. V07_P2A8T137]OXX56470.1 hypothetical protein B9J82_10945 [Vibrio sp. V10_P2A27P122]
MYKRQTLTLPSKGREFKNDHCNQHLSAPKRTLLVPHPFRGRLGGGVQNLKAITEISTFQHPKRTCF